MDKREIRKLIRERKKKLASTQVQAYSEAVAQNTIEFLRTAVKDLSVETVGVFLSLADELQTQPLINRLWSNFPHLNVLVPRVLSDNKHIIFFKYNPEGPHTISNYGIWEPVARETEALVPDVLIMPGIAFDTYGGRVGHGGGFYDRYLEDHGTQIMLKIAVAYDLQVLDQVPMEQHDIPVDAIITEKRVLRIIKD